VLRDAILQSLLDVTFDFGKANDFLEDLFVQLANHFKAGGPTPVYYVVLLRPDRRSLLVACLTDDVTAAQVMHFAFLNLNFGYL
jgi:hypothetical protein